MKPTTLNDVAECDMLLPVRTDAAALRSPRTIIADRDLAKGVASIVGQVRADGADALRRFASGLDGLPPDAPLWLGPSRLNLALASLEPSVRALLERVADRIGGFAAAQRDAIRPVTMSIPGARIGHTIEPVATAGCYAPGGRHPLPSSVLMTAITARTAGVERVIVASPSRDPIMLAAAAIAGADGFLNAGGAHAIAALAFGVESPRCDVIVGPGNRWVTEAKRQLVGTVGIDMLAGPSELLVIADGSADPDIVAADLLAQAEHDTDAAAWLVTTDPSLPIRVNAALRRRLDALPEPSRTIAAQSLGNGGAIVTRSIDDAIAISDSIAPEHLQVMTVEPERVTDRIRNAGGVFVGQRSAEVLGDYGVGPNHTLPTGGSARFAAGLSVVHFLRMRTFVRAMDDGAPLLEDTVALARLEGLEAHAAAAAARLR